MSNIKDLITRNYSNFKGVDFTGNNTVDFSRSPNAKNMWKKYDESEAIQTRPGMTLLGNFSNKILGLFFFKENNTTHVLIHSGTKLLKWSNYPNTPVQTTELFSGMNIKESKSFIFNNTLFIIDGINYLEYNGTNAASVIGTIPELTYWRTPDGGTDMDDGVDSDYVKQYENYLTSWRKNLFIADGESKNFQLVEKGLDSAALAGLTYATVNGVTKTENIDFTVNRTTGVVTFTTAPADEAKVIIYYSKTTSGLRNRILNCTLICEFNNRIFFSGNPDYPNAVFHTEADDPRYIANNLQNSCGFDLARVKALIPGNNVLWVIKERGQNDSSIHYLTPTNYNEYVGYSDINGSINLGCVSTGINFNDDIVFFSNKGLEGISNSAMYSEQILQHRSSLVDSKMLQETNYTNVKLAEYQGYLMCLIDSHIYLADSRRKYQNSSNDIEYEWFYWELPFNITFISEYRGVLYLGNDAGNIYILDGTSDNQEEIESIWTTNKDNLGYPGYTKTTNKRGNVVKLLSKSNDNIKLDTIVDGILKEKTILNDSSTIVPYRIKDKKFKEIQLKFSSNKPFGLFYCTLQGFVAGYIKK